MRKIRLLISTVFMASMFATPIVPVFADSGSGSSGSGSNDTTTTTSTDSSTKPLTAEQVAQRAADLKKRLEENKTELKTKLDEVTKKRIIAKCKPAQTVVQGAETSAEAVNTNRGKAFSKIKEAVQKLIDRLKAEGKDTSELEADLAVAQQKADALKTAMDTYKATLSDLKDMDCATDPTAFAATLEKARTERTAAKTAANDLRVYLSTTVKTAINKLKTQLQSEKSESTDTTTTTTSTTGGTN